MPHMAQPFFFEFGFEFAFFAGRFQPGTDTCFARETVSWLAREMTTPEAAFSASLDADSEDEEGKFYVWSLAEIFDDARVPDCLHADGLKRQSTRSSRAWWRCRSWRSRNCAANATDERGSPAGIIDPRFSH